MPPFPCNVTLAVQQLNSVVVAVAAVVVVAVVVAAAVVVVAAAVVVVSLPGSAAHSWMFLGNWTAPVIGGHPGAEV